jgi:hypothetical protein
MVEDVSASLMKSATKFQQLEAAQFKASHKLVKWQPALVLPAVADSLNSRKKVGMIFKKHALINTSHLSKENSAVPNTASEATVPPEGDLLTSDGPLVVQQGPEPPLFELRASSLPSEPRGECKSWLCKAIFQLPFDCAASSASIGIALYLLVYLLIWSLSF